MPLAFIMEQAGGLAINGERRVVDVVPNDIHERSALIVGSPHEVAMYQTVVNGGARKIA
jgi:fructose-1,6-bisphosphatase I